MASLPVFIADAQGRHMKANKDPKTRYMIGSEKSKPDAMKIVLGESSFKLFFAYFEEKKLKKHRDCSFEIVLGH